MKLNELVKVTHHCGLHLIDITRSRYPGIYCGSVNVDCFNEVGVVEKYKDYEVKSIYTNEEKDPYLLRVEISEK